MARRRRSILSPFGSISRNLRAMITSFLGLGILGGVGYFTFFGSPVVGNISEALNVAVYNEPQTDSDSEESNPKSSAEIPVNAEVRKPAIQSKSFTEITVGTFNIQRFGPSQLGKPSVMKTLVDIVRRFDVIAIQEIKDKEVDVVQRFLEFFNRRTGEQYDYVLSPQLGKPGERSYVERFGFIFDTKRIKVREHKYWGFVVSKERFGKTYARLPTVLQLEVNRSLSTTPFTFSLVNVHLLPNSSETRKRLTAEVYALKDIYSEVRRLLPNEDDVIILGDFNSPSAALLSSMKTLPGRKIKTALADESTMLKGKNTNDNIVFDASDTIEFVGAEVIDFRSIAESFGADPEDVSDHFPVMGAFSVHESANGSVGTIASRPQPVIR